MVLYRNTASDWYYSGTDDESREIQQELEHVYNLAIEPNQAFWTEADVDTRFKQGDQQLYNQYYGNQTSFRQKQFYFNRMRRVGNMISGYQRKNRKSTIVTGVEMSDDATASQMSKCVFQAQKRAQVDEVFSKAFDQGTVTTGMSLIAVDLDFNLDPINGDFRTYAIPYSGFLIDPFFKKQDLSDCNFIWRRNWMSKLQVQSYLPGRSEDIESMTPRGNIDGRFQFQAQAHNYAMENLFPVDEYYYSDLRPQKILMDLQTGEAIEWSGDDEDPKLSQFLELNPQIKVRETLVPTIKLAILVNGRLMYRGPTTLGIDRYPFVPLLGYYEPEIGDMSLRCQGVMRGLRDSQYLYNRRKTIELDIMESQVNSGWKYKLDALVDPNDVFLSGQGKGIALKQSAMMSDAEQIQPAAIPASMIQLSELLGREIQEISGVSDELLGMADDDSAGILSMLRQGAGLTTLQTLFDQADFSQKILGSIFLEGIQKNWRPAKVKRVTGEEPTEQFFNVSFGKYDAEVVAGVNTDTQRQIAFQQALHLRSLGIPVPSDYILGLATVQDANQLREAVAQAEQQQAQMEQQKAQVEMEMISSQKEKTDAEALAMSGYGLQHLAQIRKIDSEIVENRSQAIERTEQAKLDKVRAVKEISEMELDQIQKMIELYNSIQIDETKEALQPPQRSMQETTLSGTLPLATEMQGPQSGAPLI